MGTKQRHRWVSYGFSTQLLAAAFVVLGGSHARAQERDPAREVEGAKRWREGEPAPIGYHVARKHTLGVVGGSLLAGGYGISVLYGAALSTECYVPGADGRSDSQPCSAEPLYRAAPLLFIPIAGPFLTLTNDAVRRDGGAVFWFSAFGAIQVTGAALLAYDLAVPRYGLKRGDARALARWRVAVAPTCMGGRPGLALVGQF